MDSGSRVVLVTGAGSGLGLETALTLAEEGWRVVGAVLTGEQSDQLLGEALGRGSSLETVRFDVTNAEETQSAIRGIIDHLGLDALVHFAGIGLRGFFEDLSSEEIRRVFEINVFGSMNVARAVIPHMRERRAGRIILTTSIAGRMASMSIGGYASSKFALEGFGEALHQEMRLFDVHVSLLEPGLVATPHFGVHRNRARAALEPSSPYYSWFCRHERVVDQILSRNSFTPRDVAKVVQRILTSGRPHLRYVVGRKAKIVLSLRRHLPGEIFERIYWGFVRRLVTKEGPAPDLKAG